jgi:large subunit ribosomal protein L18
MQTTTMHKLRRRIRVRSRIHGTALRPRLTVHITAKHITAQLIDDDAGKTLGYATTGYGCERYHDRARHMGR